MSNVKTKDTKPEILLRHYLFSKGLRYLKNVAKMPGKPDIVFPKYKSVIFVNGCFWHAHTCKDFVVPKTRTEWWLEKLNKNKTRDILNYKKLEELGWNVLVVWECEIKKDLEEIGNKVAKQLVAQIK